jgi:hypothetical protein
MQHISWLSSESISAVLSVASLLVSIAATWIAGSSLSQARQVAGRDKRDWQQRKWFDLYYQLNEAYDFFDEFQKNHEATDPILWGPPELRDWNHLMNLIRRVHATAMVFPPNSAIDKLCLATAVFSDRQEALSENRLKRVLEVMDDIRMLSLMDRSVLGDQN